MSFCSTNMVNLLEDAQKAIKTETVTNGSLRSVSKVSVGPIRNPASFPVLAVIPIEERPYQVFNGGKIDNIRRIRIDAYSHKTNSKDSMRASMGMLEQAKEIFKVNETNWRIPSSSGSSPDTVYDTQIGDIIPSDNPTPYRNGFITLASLDLECYSRDDIHNNIKATSAAEVVETDSKTLVDTIANIYREYKTGTSNILSSAETFKSFTLPPQVRYPLIFVGIGNTFRDHRFTGRDEVTRFIEIHILHKVAEYKKSLRRNVTLADYCRQILFANKHFSGKAAHFEYIGISYGQLGIEGHLLYGSTVNFQIKSYEDLSVS